MNNIKDEIGKIRIDRRLTQVVNQHMFEVLMRVNMCIAINLRKN